MEVNLKNGATEVTRDQHLAATKGRKHDAENHYAWGAICIWWIDGKQHEEHQPDIGRCRWFVADHTPQPSDSDTGDSE